MYLICEISFSTWKYYNELVFYTWLIECKKTLGTNAGELDNSSMLHQYIELLNQP